MRCRYHITKPEASRGFTNYNYDRETWLSQESSILAPTARMTSRNAELPFWIKVEKKIGPGFLGKKRDKYRTESTIGLSSA